MKRGGAEGIPFILKKSSVTAAVKKSLNQIVPEDLPYQAKLLKYTCLAVILASFIGLIANIFIGLPTQLNLIICLFILLILILFIKMPLYDRYDQTGLILVSLGLLTLSINWFPNGGMVSSGPYTFLLLIGFVAITLKSYYLWIGVTLCIMTFISLIVLESFFPHWVTPLLQNSWQFKLDIITSVAILSYLLTWFINRLFKINQKRYEQVEEASQAKSLFLSQLSHELRTPLNAVIGFSNLMLKQGELPLAQQKYLESINVNGFHLLALVNQVMDLSMIEAGKIELHWQAVDLVKLLKEIEDVVSIQAAEKNLRYSSVVNIDKKRQKNIVIHSDPNRLRQILVNLINNAIKYTDSGVVTCTLRNDKNDILFEIEDTGTGIPEDKKSSIFEPLFRLEKHHQKEGKGMGLSITRSLCDHLGYRLTLVSSSPQGSVFQLFIPQTLRQRP